VDYALFLANGELITDEILRKISSIYNDELGPTHYILWDLSEADVTHLSDTDYIKIMQFIRKQGRKRLGDKTALYVPDEDQY
jgi:hypothetical protein